MSYPRSAGLENNKMMRFLL